MKKFIQKNGYEEYILVNKENIKRIYQLPDKVGQNYGVGIDYLNSTEDLFVFDRKSDRDSFFWNLQQHLEIEYTGRNFYNCLQDVNSELKTIFNEIRKINKKLYCMNKKD